MRTTYRIKATHTPDAAQLDREALSALMETHWEANGCAVYSEEVDEPLFTTHVDPDGTVPPTDLDIELAKRLAAFPAMLAALREISMHAREVLNNAEDTESNLNSEGQEFNDLRNLRFGLKQARAAIARAEGGAE